MRFQFRWNWVVTAQAAVLSLFLIFSSPSFAQANTGNNQVASTPTNAKQEDFSDWPNLVLAAQTGGGWFSNRGVGPTGYGGIKLGGSGFIFDLGYDHIPSHPGVSTEFSGLLPVLRFPRPRDEKKNYLRIFAEPGIGYRGPGGIGGYLSAKVMLVLFSDLRISSPDKVSPYIEVQRRFPFDAPFKGDNRISFGLMFAMCRKCNFDYQPVQSYPNHPSR